MIVRPLDAADKGYCLFSWREGYKKSPSTRRIPWAFFKAMYVPLFSKILDDPTNVLLGAYDEDKLLGWLVMTPGKRVDVLHWAYTKHNVRRRGVMTALLDAADLGTRFVYTGAPRTKDLEEALVSALRAKGQLATHVALREWSK